MSLHNRFEMSVPDAVAFVLDRLTESGYTAYCVGGCVRDSLMGKTPSDYDVTTSATPEKMLEVFDDQRVVETGLKHGTLTVVRDGMNIKVTTYRIDGAYGDCRHPENVTFTDRLSDDLCRRDFTVNAMAYSTRDGLVDLYGGQDDLSAGVIRCVGRAQERFSEDGLRILRALRFSSVLGFTPDGECAAAVHELKHLLEKISRERIYSEMTKLICGKNAVPIMRFFSDVVAFALGVNEDSVTHAAEFYGRDTLAPDAMMRHALILSDSDEKSAAAVMDSLKPSREEKRTVMQYLTFRDTPATTDYDVRRLISRTGDSFPAKLARFRLLSGRADEKEYEKTVAVADDVIKNDKCRSLGGLMINGNDLSSLGITGRATGETLSSLLDSVMRGEIPNEREKLTEYAEKMNQ